MARLATMLAFVPVVTMLALGCGGGDDSVKPAPTPTPAASPEPAPAPQPEPDPEPEALAPGDAVLGATVYTQNCAACHGATGGGDGPLSESLDPKPARHTDGNFMNALDDAYLARVIRDGGASVGKSPLMAPGGGALSDADIANVIAFIRSFADPPYPGAAGAAGAAGD